MKDRILKNWNVRRIFYALIGAALFIIGVAQRDWVEAVLGAYFLSMGMLAYGCAGASGCYVRMPKKTTGNNLEQ